MGTTALAPLELPYPYGPDALLPAPRPVIFSFGARCRRAWLLAGLLGLPNLLLYLGYSNGEHLRALASRGRTELATLTKKDVSRGKHTAYYFSFVFETGGKTYRDTVTVSPDWYARYAPGDPVPVTFLPLAPATHCLGRPEPQLENQNRQVLLVAALLALALGAWLVCSELSARRQLHLARVGEAVVGRVCGKEKQRSRNSTSYWIQYQFHSPVHEWARGWVSVSLSAWNSLAQGTPVTILYDPDHPGRHRPVLALSDVLFASAPDGAGG